MKKLTVLALALSLQSPLMADIHADGFSDLERDLLTRAMSVFNQRFLQKRVLQCANKTATHSQIKESYFPLLSNGDFWQPAKKQGGLLNAQLFAMNAQLDRQGQKFMPDFDLMAYNDEKDGAVAFVYNNHHVVVEDDFMTGTFEIHLNQHFLGTGGQYSDPVYYAGVIVHELLHNLGHLHPKGDYRDYLQMIAFEKCLRADGKFEGVGWGFVTTCSSRPKP